MSPFLLTCTCFLFSPPFFYSVLLFCPCCINPALCFTFGSTSLADISFCFPVMVALQSYLYLSSIHFYLSHFYAGFSFGTLSWTISHLCYLQSRITFMCYQLTISTPIRESHQFPKFDTLPSLTFRSFLLFHFLSHFLLKVTILYF